MRTPSGWTLTSQTSLQVLCACCALWGAPAVALAAPEQMTPTPVLSNPAPAALASSASNSTARIGGISIDKRVLALIAMACLVGLIAGWSRGGPGEPRVRLLIKPKKADLSVLVPPGPAPRLIPSDSPNAARARTRAPLARQTPAGATRPGVDYIAAFSDSAAANEHSQVDFLLTPSDGVEESVDAPDAFEPLDSPDTFENSLRRTG